MTTIPSYNPCECCQTPDQCEIESLTADLAKALKQIDRLNHEANRLRHHLAESERKHTEAAAERDAAAKEVTTMWSVLARRTEERDTARRRITQLHAANHHLKAELTIALHAKPEPPLADAANKDRAFHQQWNRNIRTAAQTLGYTPDDLHAALFGENGR